MVALVVLACAPVRPVVLAAPLAVARPVVGPTSEPAAVAASSSAPESVAAALWPTDCPPLAGASVVEVARISANIGDSPAGAVFIVARGELRATFAAWRDAATAAGFRVLGEHASERARAVSLIDAEGGRAFMLLQRGPDDELGGVFNRGRREPGRLRGPCVAAPGRSRSFDVERGGIDHDGGYRRERGIEVFETRFGHDLDADGELDLLVPTAATAACPRDLTWTVYLARDGCFHAVGVVGPGELSFENGAGAATGPRPLLFRSERVELGDGGTVATIVRTPYHFADGRYVRGAREQSSGVCFHCPVEICRPPPGG